MADSTKTPVITLSLIIIEVQRCGMMWDQQTSELSDFDPLIVTDRVDQSSDGCSKEEQGTFLLSCLLRPLRLLTWQAPQRQCKLPWLRPSRTEFGDEQNLQRASGELRKPNP